MTNFKKTEIRNARKNELKEFAPDLTAEFTEYGYASVAFNYIKKGQYNQAFWQLILDGEHVGEIEKCLNPDCLEYRASIAGNIHDQEECVFCDSRQIIE